MTLRTILSCLTCYLFSLGSPLLALELPRGVFVAEQLEKAKEKAVSKKKTLAVMVTYFKEG